MNDELEKIRMALGGRLPDLYNLGLIEYVFLLGLQSQVFMLRKCSELTTVKLCMEKILNKPRRKLFFRLQKHRKQVADGDDDITRALSCICVCVSEFLKKLISID